MPVDTQYGRKTGVTTFKGTMTEVCENLHKYEVFIVNWINGSALSTAQKTNLLNAIAAVDAACAAVKALPDD